MLTKVLTCHTISFLTSQEHAYVLRTCSDMNATCFNASPTVVRAHIPLKMPSRLTLPDSFLRLRPLVLHVSIMNIHHLRLICQHMTSITSLSMTSGVARVCLASLSELKSLHYFTDPGLMVDLSVVTELPTTITHLNCMYIDGPQSLHLGIMDAFTRRHTQLRKLRLFGIVSQDELTCVGSRLHHLEVFRAPIRTDVRTLESLSALTSLRIANALLKTDNDNIRLSLLTTLTHLDIRASKCKSSSLNFLIPLVSLTDLTLCDCDIKDLISTTPSVWSRLTRFDVSDNPMPGVMIMLSSLGEFFTSLHTLVAFGYSLNTTTDVSAIRRVVHAIPSLMRMQFFRRLADYEHKPRYLAIVAELPAARRSFRFH